MDSVPSLAETNRTGVKQRTGKFVRAVRHIIASIVNCYPKRKDSQTQTDTNDDDVPPSRLMALPSELLLIILSKCDSSTKMNLRAVNRRLHYLVDDSAGYCSRVNLIGGVEIEEDDRSDNSSQTDDGEYSKQLTLRRTHSKREIRLPAYRLTNIMRHVCVFHSLRLCGVPLDEQLAHDILDAKFQTISHLVVDRVHSVTSETLSRLVKKVYPSRSLHILNNSTTESEMTISPDVLDSCSALDVSVFSGNSTLVHRLIDDDALLKLILNEEGGVKRSIRLPHCAVTHEGLNRAGNLFYTRCLEVIEEMTDGMESPAWEINVSLPKSSSINIHNLVAPAAMLPFCSLALLSSDIPPAFIFEVRVQTMCLRIRVE